MFRTFLAVLLIAAASLSATFPSEQTENGSFRLGVIIPRVAATQNPQQTYTLYLPKRYSPEIRWPVVYIFDPLARGELAVRQFKHAAELHGFIVAASNNSRNGPWVSQFEAAEAMVNDTQQRLAIDARRIYFAGFSGGARVSAQLALLCKCAAGVVLSGAGFPQNSPPSPSVKFAVFSAVGDADFNYSEVIPLQDQLEKAALPHWLRVFDGPHEWAPANVLDEALAWFRLQAMKANLEPSNDEFVTAQFAVAKDRAESCEKSGDLLSAWREYRQIAATFQPLADVRESKSRSDGLERDKAVRDALRRERGAFADQDRLSTEVLSAVSATTDPHVASDRQPQQAPEQLARELRQRSLAEKKLDRALIVKRALGGVFVGSIESGNAALEKKDYAGAAQYFACAAEANPESEGVLRQLAVARALSGDRQGAIEALRSARKVTKDIQSLADWCQHEIAFAQLRRMADFKAIAE